MLNHFVEIAANVTAFDDFLRAANIKRYFRKQSSDVQAKFLTLAVFWIEKDATEFANCALCQLAVALVYIS